MANINLLPWREELREQKKRDFIYIFASIVTFSVIMLVALHFAMSHRIGVQKNRNDFIKGEITILDKKIAEIEGLRKLKESLVTRMGIIQELQLHRPRIVHLFDDMVVSLPKGVYLKKLLLKGDKISINGISESNTSISALMRNIDASKWLTKPVLSEIKTTDIEGKSISNFSLESLLTDPKKLGNEK